MVKVFLTGGTGYVGSVLVELLLRAGHSVRGLARSEHSAKKLTAAKVEPVTGDLQSFDILKEEAKRADADSGVLGKTKGAAASSGPGSALDDTPGRRWRLEQAYAQAASQGVQCGVFRLPLHVYGRNEIAPMLTDFAKRDGVARYIGDGSNTATVVHVEDVASAFVLALDKPFASGTIFNLGDPGDVGITGKMVAEAIAKRLSLERVESVSFHEAVESWGFVLAYWYSLTNVLDTESTKSILGWSVADGRSFLRDIVNG